MNPMRLFSNLRIKHKLILPFFVLPITLIIIVGLISHNSSTNALRRQSHYLIYQYQQSSIAEIQRTLDRYEFLANTISRNVGISQLMSPNRLDPFQEYLSLINVLYPTLNATLYATDAGINIQLIRYHDYNSEIIYGNIENLLETLRVSEYYISGGRRQFQLVNFERVQDRLWVQEAKYYSFENKWMQVGHDRDYNYISLLHELTATSDFRTEPIGLLRLTIMFSTIYSEDLTDSNSGFSLIFNEQMELLSGEAEKVAFFRENESFLRSFSDSSESETVLNSQELLLVKSQPFANDWFIISVFPMQYITENINIITNTIIITLIGSAILLFLLTYFLSNSFSKRINAISMQMQSFKSGSLDAKISGSGQDEIGLLGEIFNDMTEQISTLIHDNYQSNIDKKEALLKALQAQINPHLLYNSLSAVGRLADLGETDEINRMINALTKFYRITLSKGNEIITVENELSHVQAFIEIFQIRIGEMFSVTYTIDDKALEYHTIKVILQPFVENVFEHALKLDDSVININITVQSEEEAILFTIQDDGTGIPPERLGKLLTSNAPDTYGVANVNERIKLQFGSQYGVNITSCLGAGTRVDIRIPKVIYD